MRTIFGIALGALALLLLIVVLCLMPSESRFASTHRSQASGAVSMAAVGTATAQDLTLPDSPIRVHSAISSSNARFEGFETPDQATTVYNANPPKKRVSHQTPPSSNDFPLSVSLKFPQNRGFVAGGAQASPASAPLLGGVNSSESLPVWEVDEGLPLPLVVSATPPHATDAMKVANESITQKFEESISSGPTTAPEVVVTDKVWNTARRKADDLYKILYGDAAYNAHSIEAARSALHP